MKGILFQGNMTDSTMPTPSLFTRLLITISVITLFHPKKSCQVITNGYITFFMVACQHKNIMQSKQEKIDAMVISYHFSKFKKQSNTLAINVDFLEILHSLRSRPFFKFNPKIKMGNLISDSSDTVLLRVTLTTFQLKNFNLQLSTANVYFMEESYTSLSYIASWRLSTHEHVLSYHYYNRKILFHN